MKDMIAQTREELIALFKAPQQDTELSFKQESTYRDVISLQAIFVTLTIALLAYIQKDPVFRIRVDVLFAMMALLPIVGLIQIIRGRVKTSTADIHVYTRPIRAYARQALIMELLFVLAISVLYWLGELPGQ